MIEAELVADKGQGEAPFVEEMLLGKVGNQTRGIVFGESPIEGFLIDILRGTLALGAEGCGAGESLIVGHGMGDEGLAMKDEG